MVTRDALAGELKGGAKPTDVLVLKGFDPAATVLKTDVEQRKIAVTTSTQAVDRDKDTIAVDGWDLSVYRTNPVVLLCHKADQLPIATAEMVVAGGGALKSRLAFPPQDKSARADEVFELMRYGILKGISAGFKPVTFDLNRERGGIDFRKQLLLEQSVVPIPSNPEALAEIKSLGIEVPSIREWCKQVLSETEGEGLWLPRDTVEKALSVISGRPVSVAVPATPPEPREVPPGDHASGGVVLKIHSPRVVRRGGKFCVIDSDGHKYGEHDSAKDANAQVAALRAAKKEKQMPEPAFRFLKKYMGKADGPGQAQTLDDIMAAKPVREAQGKLTELSYALQDSIRSIVEFGEAGAREDLLSQTFDQFMTAAKPLITTIASAADESDDSEGAAEAAVAEAADEGEKEVRAYAKKGAPPFPPKKGKGKDKTKDEENTDEEDDPQDEGDGEDEEEDSVKALLLDLDTQLKQGRALSKEREDKLRQAHGHLSSAAGHLKDVLDSASPKDQAADDEEDAEDGGADEEAEGEGQEPPPAAGKKKKSAASEAVEIAPDLLDKIGGEEGLNKLIADASAQAVAAERVKTSGRLPD